MIYETPLLLKGEMVRAILDSLKTQTRREVTRLRGFGNITEFRKSDTPGYDWQFRDKRMCWNDLSHADLLAACPFGKPGDHLWVRETWAYCPGSTGLGSIEEGGAPPIYKADDDSDLPENQKWKPAIHMPRMASRLTLEITDIRLERVRSISPDDAIAEGLTKLTKDDGRTYKYGIPESDGLPGPKGWPWQEWEVDPSRAFLKLWEQLYGYDAVNDNPWVWVIEFKVVTDE